jgi:hypothetical protein
MSFPASIEKRTREEWEAIGRAVEPAEKKPIIDALKALGYKYTDYMGMLIPDRVDAIMKAQEEDDEKKPAKGKAKPTEEVPRARLLRDAPKDTPSTTRSLLRDTPAPKAAAVPAETPPDVAELRKAVADLHKTVSSLEAMIKDTHYLVRVIVESDSRFCDNAGIEDVQEMLYGKLVVSGNG